MARLAARPVPGLAACLVILALAVTAPPSGAQQGPGATPGAVATDDTPAAEPPPAPQIATPLPPALGEAPALPFAGAPAPEPAPEPAIAPGPAPAGTPAPDTGAETDAATAAEADTTAAEADPAATEEPAGAADTALPDAPAPGLAVPGPAGPPAHPPENPTPEPAGDLPSDLSPLGMYLAADWVVKGVMIALALASVLTWTVFVVKAAEIALANRRARASARLLAKAASLAEARAATGHHRGTVAAMIRLGAAEYARSWPSVAEAGGAGLKERVASLLGRLVAQAGRRLQRGTGILASIGSVAPFVGLFGTVWGIMNAFIGISRAQTTNLAVVAPGIAEALLATALGLVAAIPAVVIYNLFARAIAGHRQSLADAAAGVERLVSRDLDFRRPPEAAPAPAALPAALPATAAR